MLAYHDFAISLKKSIFYRRIDKISLFTGSIAVRSKHIYTQSTGRNTCSMF